MNVSERDIIEHRSYLLSLSLRCLSIFTNEKMKKHYTKQLFIEEEPETGSFFNPFVKTPLILNKMNILTHVPDKIGETRITTKGELIGRRPIIKTKMSSKGNYICDPTELSVLLDIPLLSLENDFNLTKEDDGFLFRFCYMTFGAALIYKGIRIKDDYYEEKFSKENYVGIGYRVHRIPDDIYKRSLTIFGSGPIFQQEPMWNDVKEVETANQGVENDDALGGIPLQNKILKYVNKTQLMSLKNNGLENQKMYEAWKKYGILNGNVEMKGLNIGNIWRLDNMLNLQELDAPVGDIVDQLYYKPDNFENNDEDFTQLKNNILNLTTKEIVDLQNKHSVLKTSHELNKIVKSRKLTVKRLKANMQLTSFKPESSINKDIQMEFLNKNLGISEPKKVKTFVENVIIKNDAKLISILNDKKTDAEGNTFWQVSNDSYDDAKRLQTIDIDFSVPNKNVFSWMDFLEHHSK